MFAIQFFCPRWGSEHLSWPVFIQQVKEAGYDGIEFAIAHTTTRQELDEVWNLAQQKGLDIIPQHYDTQSAAVAQHIELTLAWFEKIKPYPAKKINSQTGRDFFSMEENTRVLEAVRQATTGQIVCHETHRGKFSFAAHITQQYLKVIPWLELTLDMSHWVCVAESDLADQKPAMEEAVTRTQHIHARIGFSEGPQITDPRLAEWQEAVALHLHWWDRVVQCMREKQQALTISAEFGPHPYMLHHPGTQQPLASQWAINVYMADLLRSRYT